MKIEILSFTGNLFKSETVESVTAMTKIGEVTILEGHTPLVTVLSPSIVSIVYTDDDGKKSEKDFAVGGGILEVSNSNVKLLIDMLVSVDNLNVDEAEKAKKEALKLMGKYKDSKDKVDMDKFIAAEDMLLKSLVQLKLGDINK
ncbi:MAG: ATP synthase F1 subunit epsilon [Candidatus Gracilibacteria bacterium]